MNPILSAASVDLGLGSSMTSSSGDLSTTPGVESEEEKRRKAMQQAQQSNFGSIFSGGAVGDLFGGVK